MLIIILCMKTRHFIIVFSLLASNCSTKNEFLNRQTSQKTNENIASTNSNMPSKKETEQWLLNNLYRYAYVKFVKDPVTSSSIVYQDYKFAFRENYLLINYAVGSIGKEDHREQMEIPVSDIADIMYNPSNTELTILRDGEGINAKGFSILNLKEGITHNSSDFLSVPFRIDDRDYESMNQKLSSAFVHLSEIAEPF